MAISTYCGIIAIPKGSAESTCWLHIQQRLGKILLFPRLPLLQVQQNVIYFLSVELGKPAVVQGRFWEYASLGDAVSLPLQFVVRIDFTVVPMIILFVIQRGTTASRFVWVFLLFNVVWSLFVVESKLMCSENYIVCYCTSHIIYVLLFNLF